MLRHAVNQKVGGGDGLCISLPFGLGVKKFVFALEVNKHFLSIVRHVVSADVFGKNCFLAVLHRIENQVGRRITVAAVKRSADLCVNQIILGHGKALVVIAFDRNARNAIGQSIEINTNVFFWLFVFLLFLFFFRLCFVGASWLFAFFRDADFIAFRRKWILHVLAQRQSEDSGAAVGCIVEFDLAKRRLKIMNGSVIEIVAVRVPGGTTRIEQVAGNAMDLTVGNTPDIDGPKIVWIAQGERKVPAVARPGVIAQIPPGILGNLRDLFAFESQDKELSVLVRKRDVFAI